ncbi:DUF4185 domain-containing protein [Rhodopirellula bahusiensis]|nr:DUF4185 domain-containing protein [Rhodopirellula bahusiensis]
MNRSGCLIVTVITLLAFELLTAHAALRQQPPYPQSSVIKRVEFDFATHRRLAPGSDNWPVTWADDGHLYTAWGDGGGFGGTNSEGRVKLGVARIDGNVEGYSGINIWGGFKPQKPPQFDGKSYGIISVDGVLYMWVAAQPARHMESSAIAQSTDHGMHWKLADWKYTFEDELSVPTFLNFGQDNSGARDEYVYSYLIEPTWGPGTLPQTEHGFDVHKPGRIHLTRVPKELVFQRDRHQFFAGFATDGSATWSSNIEAKQPVFEDSNGVGWNVSVSYNAGLRRYILCTEHSQSHAGQLGMFDASEPWGPWTTVAYENSWGEGQIETSAFFWNFTQKWISADGAKFTMIFSGKNSNDSWNTIDGRFILPAPDLQ